jgi:4-hydroxybenzoate polyprenyltransferase
MALLRALWGMTRPAGLPTVWSNCLAGWWLGGHQNPKGLPLALVAASLMYVGGTLLNDIFDVEFDKACHETRPLPSGTVPWNLAWRSGLVLLALGALLLFGAGTFTASFGLGTVLCIVGFNALQRVTAGAVVLLGMCRLFVYLIAASVSTRLLTGWPVWSGLALGAYVCGLRLFRPENLWSLAFMGCPIALAVIMDAGPYREGGLLLSAVFGLWVLLSLRQSLWSQESNLARTVAGLQAGIVLADWLAVADAPRAVSFVFLALFGTSLLLRKRTA